MKFKTAFIWNGISQLGQSGIQFLSTVILARLLTPDDFGIIGLTTIFITLGSMMVDSEMGAALLRKRKVTKIDYSTLFFYNLIVSLIIYILLFFLAPLISSFYHRPPLTGIIRIISLSIVIHAFRVVQQIMIFRKLDFKSFAIISLCSGVLSLFVAVSLAIKGFGYWALVWQGVFSAVFNVILMTIKNRFFPIFRFSINSFKEQFSFGISLLGSDMLKVIANNISLNIIGKFAPLKLTGNYTQYSRITSFSQSFFGSLLNQSIYPMMAKIDDDEVFKIQYKRLFTYVILMMMVISFVVILFSKYVIWVLLGKDWLSNQWMIKILSLTILPTTLQILNSNILKAKGYTRLILGLESLKSVIVLSLLLISILGGIEIIVWAVALGQTLSGLIIVFKTSKCIYGRQNYQLTMYGLSSSILYIFVFFELL